MQLSYLAGSISVAVVARALSTPPRLPDELPKASLSARKNADSFDSLAQIRCIGKLPVQHQGSYENVRGLCAKPDYGGSLVRWTAGAYCGHRYAPQMVLFERAPDDDRDDDDHFDEFLFCNNRCRCVNGTSEDVISAVEGGPLPREIVVAENDPELLEPFGIQFSFHRMDTNPLPLLAFNGRDSLRKENVPIVLYFVEEQRADGLFFRLTTRKYAPIRHYFEAPYCASDGIPEIAAPDQSNDGLIPYRRNFKHVSRRHGYWPDIGRARDEVMQHLPSAYPDAQTLCAARWFGGSSYGNAGRVCIPGGDVVTEAYWPLVHKGFAFGEGDEAQSEIIQTYCKQHCRCGTHETQFSFQIALEGWETFLYPGDIFRAQVQRAPNEQFTSLAQSSLNNPVHGVRGFIGGQQSAGVTTAVQKLHTCGNQCQGPASKTCSEGIGGCQCIVPSRLVSTALGLKNTGPFTGHCLVGSAVSMVVESFLRSRRGSVELRRRDLAKLEEPWRCPCNGTFVHEDCCDSSNGWI